MIKQILTIAKAAVVRSISVLAGAPLSGVVKAAVFCGVTAFTAWVMIRHTKKMHDDGIDATSADDCYSPVDEVLGKNYVTDPTQYREMDPLARKVCKKLQTFVPKRKKKKDTKPKVQQKPLATIHFVDKETGKEDHDQVLKAFAAMDEAVFGNETDDDLDIEEKPVKKKKPAKSKKKPKPMRESTMARIERAVNSWDAAGFNIGQTQERIDEFARMLGFEVDQYEVDDKITPEIREKFPMMF